MKRKLLRRITSMALAGAMSLSALAVSTTTPVMAATVSQLKEGIQYKIVSKKTGKVLTVENDSKSNSAKIEQQTEDTKASQLWELDFDNEGYCNIINVNSGKALDIPNKSKTKGEKIIQFDKNTNSDNQKWKISEVSGDYCKITTKLSTGYALNIEGAKTDNGAKLIQWNYGGGSNEQWRFVEVKKETTNENYANRFEAEDYVYGDASVVNSPNASGGKYVGNVKGESVYAFMWSETATYTLRIRYASGEARKMHIDIRNNNGWPLSTTYDVDCPSTGGWDKMSEVEVDVQMQEGYSHIVISGKDGHYAPNIDCVEVVEKENAGTVVFAYEAEDYAYGDTSVVNSSNASGGKYVGDIKDDYDMSGRIEKSTWTPEGKFGMRLYYASEEEREFSICLRAKHGNPQTRYYNVTCPSTGGWQKFGVVEIEVETQEVFTDIMISGPEDGRYAPNLDRVEFVEY